MEIKTFGKITDIVDQEVYLDFPLSISELRKQLETQFPLLKTIVYRIAIDDQLISDESFILINPKSIALMPPFSGG